MRLSVDMRRCGFCAYPTALFFPPQERLRVIECRHDAPKEM